MADAVWCRVLELPEKKVAYIFDIGGPHTFRTIYMDGRKHPENLTPSYYGHSIGWWEGDTLVVDTIGFNEGFWIDRGQLPHTTQLHLIEKSTRTALDSMQSDLTVDDPGAYTAPFTGTSNLRWENGTELFEYVCQQGNEAHTLMVGDGTSVDRTTPVDYRKAGGIRCTPGHGAPSPLPLPSSRRPPETSPSGTGLGNALDQGHVDAVHAAHAD